jgi:hypothetical protein
MADASVRRMFRIVKYATGAFVISVLIVAAGFAFPQTIGLLINPHAQFGGIGLFALLIMDTIVFVILAFCLPYSVRILVRDKGARTPSLIGVAVIGGIATVIIGWMVASVVIDRLK